MDYDEFVHMMKMVGVLDVNDDSYHVHNLSLASAGG